MQDNLTQPIAGVELDEPDFEFVANASGVKVSMKFPTWLRTAARLILAHMVLCLLGFGLALAGAVSPNREFGPRLFVLFGLFFLAVLGTGYGIWLEFKNSAL